MPETNRFILFSQEPEKDGSIPVGLIKAVYNPDGKYSPFKYEILTKKEKEFVINAIPDFKKHLID